MSASTTTGVPLRLVQLERGPDELPVHVVATPDLRLAFLPTVGGRLISLECRGSAQPWTNLLWTNPEYLDAELRTIRPRRDWAPVDHSMGSWANVGGSKTWPAPQGWSGLGEWAGPPDPVLDSGSWTVASRWSEAAEHLTVRLTSPDDPRTGLRVVREFVVPASGTTFEQRNRFRNVSDRVVRWSLWEVCQVDTAPFAVPHDHEPHDGGAGLWVGVAGAAAPVSLVEADGAIVVGEPVAGRRAVGISDVVAKVGFTDATGRIEFRRPDGAGIDWRFDVHPAADAVYPDGGCQVELWMQYPTPEPLSDGDLHPSARLVELEALSPLHDLAPDETAELAITWTVTPGR
jgi:hypothetical protein